MPCGTRPFSCCKTPSTKISSAAERQTSTRLCAGASRRCEDNPFGGQPLRGTTPSGGQPLRGDNPFGGTTLRGDNPFGGQPLRGTTPSGDNPLRGTTPSGDNPFGGTTPSGGQPLRGDNPFGGPLLLVAARGLGFAVLAPRLVHRTRGA